MASIGRKKYRLEGYVAGNLSFSPMTQEDGADVFTKLLRDGSIHRGAVPSGSGGPPLTGRSI
jgi:hypothetical protein